jgi:hypothetical protein
MRPLGTTYGFTRNESPRFIVHLMNDNFHAKETRTNGRRSRWTPGNASRRSRERYGFCYFKDVGNTGPVSSKYVTSKKSEA